MKSSVYNDIQKQKPILHTDKALTKFVNTITNSVNDIKHILEIKSITHTTKLQIIHEIAEQALLSDDVTILLDIQ